MDPAIEIINRNKRGDMVFNYGRKVTVDGKQQKLIERPRSNEYHRSLAIAGISREG